MRRFTPAFSAALVVERGVGAEFRRRPDRHHAGHRVTGQVELPGGGQAVAAVVALAADDQGVPVGIARPDEQADPQGRPLHEDRTRHAHVFDGRPVQLPHLGRREDRGPFRQREEAGEAARAAAGPCRRSQSSNPSFSSISLLPRDVRSPPRRRPQANRRARARPVPPPIPRSRATAAYARSRITRGAASAPLRPRAPSASNLDLVPRHNAGTQEFTNRLLGRETRGEVQHRRPPGPAVRDLGRR